MLLHDTDVRTETRKRIEALRPDSQRAWGTMTVDQMLWHVNLSLREALGEYTTAPHKVPMPRSWLRWLVLNVPTPKGSRTRPDMVALERHDFATEKQRCLDLVDQFVRRDLESPWPNSASLGAMSGRHWSRLQAQHLDHHLRQFRV